MKKFLAIPGLALAFSAVLVGNAFAAADTLTGIDPAAEVTTALTSAKLWIAAGVTLMVVGIALSKGRQWLGKTGGAKG